MAGRREGSRGGSRGRQLLSWRAPTSSKPKPAVTGCEMKSPDAKPVTTWWPEIAETRTSPKMNSDSHFLAGQRMRSGDSLPEHTR